MHHSHVSLAHGNGGRLMRQLIDEVFYHHLGNDFLDVSLDAAPISLDGGEVFVTTDGFTVKPLEFPGGNIGSLAVHGTVNDLSVAGAHPQYLTLNAYIEEGLAFDQLNRIVESLAKAARQCGVQVAAGDTKVVGKGEGGGLYLATTGIGVRDNTIRLGFSHIKEGDAILVSGPVGDHGTAVMLAREQFGLRGDLASDSASVFQIAQTLLQFNGLRFMRDPTRGGLATVMHEIARNCGLGIRLQEQVIPLQDPVRSVCEILGYDPLYLACEGRLVAVVDTMEADDALASVKFVRGGEEAALIGTIDRQGLVVIETEFGGERVLDELEDDPLPRIC